MDNDVDVVVIGAGLAGLTAARRVVDAGASALVIEARDRVGGRTLSREVGGHFVDLGGQWIGPGQRRMYALARDLGVATFPTYARGRKVMSVRGKVSTYAGTIPSLSPPHLLLLHHVLSRVEKMRRGVPADRPFTAEGAGALDAQTLAAWQRLHVPSRTVREVFDVAVRVVFGAEASELSLLHFLYYVNSAGGLMPLVEIENGAQQDRFARGAQEIAIRLASSLGERVILGAPVRRIAQDAGGATVETDRGRFRGRAAIVAVPPHLAGRIDYDPPLPPDRDALTQRMPMGATTKCMAFYDRPFWREAGLSGEAICSGDTATVVFDNSPPDGSTGVLLAFLVGRNARAWAARPAPERRRAVLDQLARFFGSCARDPVDYLEHDWSAEPWSRGCPTGAMPPGTLTLLGPALRAPVGRLFWAGTETATEHTGYMEGAVESGERAAREALGRL